MHKVFGGNVFIMDYEKEDAIDNLLHPLLSVSRRVRLPEKKVVQGFGVRFSV